MPSCSQTAFGMVIRYFFVTVAFMVMIDSIVVSYASSIKTCLDSGENVILPRITVGTDIFFPLLY